MRAALPRRRGALGRGANLSGRIDAHAHLWDDHPATLRTLEGLDVRVLNLCIGHREDWRAEKEHYARMARAHPGRFAWCTALEAPRGDDPRWAERRIEEIAQDLDAGAVGCKLWKHVGMGARRSDGTWLRPDDPELEPVLAFLEREGVPLVLHCGDPRAAWEPLEGPLAAYYRRAPEWHLHGRADAPSRDDLRAAADRVLERHPRLRVVGAHLASQDDDLPALRLRLSRYANLAVDLSARLAELLRHDPSVVRAFLLDHAGRVLFGTDHGADLAGGARLPLADAERERRNAGYRHVWRLAAAALRHAPWELPADVVERILGGNARDWFPRLSA